MSVPSPLPAHWPPHWPASEPWMRNRPPATTMRRVGTRLAVVRRLEQQHWIAEVYDVYRVRDGCRLAVGAPLCLGEFGGRRAGMDAADEWLDKINSEA